MSFEERFFLRQGTTFDPHAFLAGQRKYTQQEYTDTVLPLFTDTWKNRLEYIRLYLQHHNLNYQVEEDQELIDNYLIEHCWDCWILEAEYIESNDFVLLVYRHLELSPYIPNSNYISDPPTSGTFFEDPWDRTIGYKDSYF